MHDCRVIVDVPRSAAWNMAVDEMLLGRALKERRLQLRLYAWESPTVSLGYFQRVAARSQHPPSGRCPFVRRPSGGGAIVHDEEITYSLVLPFRAGIESAAFYRCVHSALATMLSRHGMRAVLADSSDTEPAGRSRFLCFQRRSAGDVLIDGHKVVGSAQRRVRGALLQHGSILLAASHAAPELPGINDLIGISLNRDEWQYEVLTTLIAALDCRASKEALKEDEALTAEQLAAAKYARWQWNARR